MKLERILGLGVSALVFLAAPAAADDLKLPEGKVALHYFRSDGKYGGWGIHVWESFQKPEEADKDLAAKQRTDQPLTSWGSPMQPSGTDDFGVYWLLDEASFHNGRVNYIIHRGDTKDQCSADKFWMIKDSREAWVNAGDCNVYLSKEAALKARK